MFSTFWNLTNNICFSYKLTYEHILICDFDKVNFFGGFLSPCRVPRNPLRFGKKLKLQLSRGLCSLWIFKNGYTLEYHLQTQKLEPPCTAK